MSIDSKSRSIETFLRFSIFCENSRLRDIILEGDSITKINIIKINYKIRFFFTLLTITKKRIAKFSNLLLFINIDNFLFENQILKLYNKLILNKNYFEINIIKTIYTIEKVANIIAKYINIY